MSATTAWECLKDSTLAFTPPSRFNDPFDTNIAVDYEPRSDDLRAWYRCHSAGRAHGLSEDRFIEMHLNEPTRFEKVLKDAKDAFIERDVGVACFTEQANDPLMWAHYADKHRGVMIGFDTSNPIFSNARLVKYSKMRPVHRRLGGRLSGKEMMKSNIWKCEREWRVSAALGQCEVRMIAQTPIYLQTLPRDSFASVTFGCRASVEFKSAVALSLSKWGLMKCELQEMQLCDLTYKLKPKEFTG